MKHERIEAGQWVQPIFKGYKMTCCDCGLVHRLEFRIVGTRRQRIQFRAWRDARSTAAVRREDKKWQRS